MRGDIFWAIISTFQKPQKGWKIEILTNMEMDMEIV